MHDSHFVPRTQPPSSVQPKSRPSAPAERSTRKKADLRSLLGVGLLLVGLLVGCSAADLVNREPEPVPTRVPAPTFSPTPEFIRAPIVVTPPRTGTPGVLIVPPGVDPSTLIPIPTTPPPTATQPEIAPPEGTPLAMEPPGPQAPTATGPASPILLPTATPTPLPTDTPTPTPTPYVVVESGLVNLRSGPGPEYPLVAQLGPGIPVAIVGQNPEGTWYQICCVNGESVWVAENHVRVVNDTRQVALVLADPPPTATPTPTATDTPTITPTPTATPYPFAVAEGPLFFPSNNPWLTIWVKVFVPNPGGDIPLPGYHLDVKFRNRDFNSSFESRPNTKGEEPSFDHFEYSVPPGTASGNRVPFNYKYEFKPPDPRSLDPTSTDSPLKLIDGYWQIYLTDGAGNQLSAPIEFNTLLGNPNLEVYVAWARIR
ncbi:MAG: hypothetical protein KatS3mg050_1878 [Litorilinea sp.]|nr:MAG: hypothetical protein KatS3mg050_1878 [Litorilinea sp.]